MNNEITFLVGWFVQILFWVDFEYVITHLESNWLKFWSNIFTTVFHVAECFVRCAVKVWKSRWPFLSNFIENIWRNWQLWTSSIYDSWIWGVLSWFLHWLWSVKHSLTFKGPSTKPVLEVFKGFKTLSSTNNLGWVVTTKQCIWCFTHFLLCDTETNHGSVNNSVVFKWPQIMELLLFHIFMRR